MKLPNLEKAEVSKAKILDYLLADTTIAARAKANFFTRFGFARSDWRVLERALLLHSKSHDVETVQSDSYGERYTIVGELICPDGRSPVVKSVWIIEKGFNAPRLITAYPSQRRKDDQRT